MKNLIIERLHKLIEDKGYRIVPQDYSKEFGQTGSGKAIQYKKTKLAADPEQIRLAMYRISQATIIDQQYREAYKNGIPDNDGIIHFESTYMGKKYDCQIPPQFKEDKKYYYYFNSSEIGDGLIPIKITKEGKIEGGNIRTRPDIEITPTLSNMGADYNITEYAAYFNVRVGVKGKYQKENKRYSVFPTPAIDANVKTHVIYKTEILDYLKGGGDYTSDEKGKELSAKMNFDKKINKIIRDAQNIIGKPIRSNKTWLDWFEQLKLNYDTPEKQQAMDAEAMLKDFIELYKTKETIPSKETPKISMPPDEEAEWEKQQKEKLARIAAARARMKK